MTVGTLMGKSHAFERGERLYITTPLTLSRPTDEQVEEFAFSSAVKSKAPNEHIGWLQGRYVQAGRPNLNGAMWLSDELALKALTPMLMPITVMHDPSTAVGVIADTKYVEEEGGCSRLDNMLAVWRHRFPDEWAEVEANINRGTMMQSMECFAPHYACADCGETFVKLSHGAERASWCSHLKGDTPRRILGDVCFTGTGLIFGTRGGVGAYTDAQLDHFHEEIAEYHERTHTDTSRRPKPKRSQPKMGMIEIDETELATLRSERNAARAEVDTLKDSNRELTTKVEVAEAAKVQAEQAKAAAEQKVAIAEQAAAASAQRDTRLSALGAGFMAALGETSKAKLTELAGTLSDADWDIALKEREEIAHVLRDAKADAAGGEGGAPAGGGAPATGTSFKDGEVASFLGRSGQAPAIAGPVDGTSAVKALARSFNSKPRQPANA